MGRREQNKQRKRERLVHEGLRLFLELGYDRCSIEQIAAASGVARGTFYLYFETKLALFETLMDRWYEPVLAVLRAADARLGDATDRAELLGIYQQMALGLIAVALENRDPILVAFREARRAGEAGERLRERELAMHRAAFALTDHAVERGLVTVEDPRLATLVIFGAVEKLYFEALVGTDLGEPALLATNVVALVGRALGLGEPPGARPVG